MSPKEPVGPLFFGHYFSFGPTCIDTDINIKNELYKIKYEHKSRGSLPMRYPTLNEFLIMHKLESVAGMVYGCRRKIQSDPVIKKLEPRTVSFD